MFPDEVDNFSNRTLQQFHFLCSAMSQKYSPLIGVRVVNIKNCYSL